MFDLDTVCVRSSPGRWQQSFSYPELKLPKLGVTSGMGLMGQIRSTRRKRGFFSAGKRMCWPFSHGRGNILIQRELLPKALRPLTNKTHLSLITKEMSAHTKKCKQITQVREKETESKWGRVRSMTRSESGKEPADLKKSWRKVIFNPRLENNFTFPQISLKNLLLSELGRFIQINGL